jgi:hypothetical protein
MSAQALALAAGDFPYGNLILKVPAQEDPYPGIGGNFSSLGKGIDTVLWNPAGLAKIGTSEINLGFTSTATSPPYNKNYEVKDTTFEVGSTSTTGFSNAILYTSDLTVINPTTREYTGHLNYSTVTNGINYKQAIKIADTFAFGISTRGETGYSLSLAGNFPAQWKSDLDLHNVTNFMGSGISINNNGQITYTYTPSGGTPYTYTSANPVWSGFLNQSQRIPFTAISDAHNDLNVQSNLTMTGAAKWGNLSLGANITPISAAANINNSVRMIVKEGTGDVYFYVPNFNPNNEAEVVNWINDPNLFGAPAGYKKRYFRVPAGETVAEAKYNGFYQASTARMDLGAMYDFGENFTLGMALENFNNASLDFRGYGRVAYVNSRISTIDATGLIDPAGTSYNFFSDTFIPVKDTENIGMLAQIPSQLPQKFRIGATLRKPFLITLDYEKQANPITYRYQKSDSTYGDLVISNINYLRGGFETQFLFLPMILKGGLTVMLKPDISGADSQMEDNFNKAFKYQMLPLKLDLGAGFAAWGSEIGGGFGFSLMPIFSTLQLDTLNQDFSKMGYYNMFIKKDFWQVTYMSVLDPGSTAAAYSSATDKNNWMSYIKSINTLTVSVRF